jgi:hypothetical protein
MFHHVAIVVKGIEVIGIFYELKSKTLKRDM